MVVTMYMHIVTRNAHHACLTVFTHAFYHTSLESLLKGPASVVPVFKNVEVYSQELSLS